jgi:CheY-like chemotaxis protein
MLIEPTLLKMDCACNGLEALRMFNKAPEKHDMIFMDLQMQEMDGFEATERIRALETPRAKNVPIIALTANVFRDDDKAPGSRHELPHREAY